MITQINHSMFFSSVYHGSPLHGIPIESSDVVLDDITVRRKQFFFPLINSHIAANEASEICRVVRNNFWWATVKIPH